MPGCMSSPQQLFQQFLDAQRAEYGRSLPGKVAQIEALWRLAAGAGPEPGSMVQLERLAHTLAGTAGTLGFVATGQAARALELLLQQEALQGGGEGTALHPDIERAVAALLGSLPRADSAAADICAPAPATVADKPKGGG